MVKTSLKTLTKLPFGTTTLQPYLKSLPNVDSFANEIVCFTLLFGFIKIKFRHLRIFVGIFL